MPSRLLARYPSMHALSILFSCQMLHLFDESSQPLPQRPIVRGLASVVDEKDATELSPQRLADGFGHALDLGRQLECGV